MGIPHQAVNCKRIILLFVFIFSNVLNTLPAKAYDSLFVVEGIKVDVTADNSVKAGEQAFEQAQVKAFKVLSKRMVAEAQAANLPTPDSLTISSFVKDYEITNESLSSIRYVGTYTFRFNEAAVSKYFSVSGVSFTQASSKPLLVLPIFQINGKNSIWSEDNIWMESWVRSNLSGGLVPIEVPIGDLMDISDIDDNNALSYDRKNLDQMLARYNAKEAAIMIAVPDLTLAAVTSDKARASGYLRISIYRTDRVSAEHVKDLNLETTNMETRAELYDRAVQSSFSALQKDWKRKTLSSAAQKQNFQVRALFDSLKQWTQIQQALNATIGLSELSILSLKRTDAMISFTFRGDAQRLRETLARSALNLDERIGREASALDHVVYDLYMGRKKTKAQSFYQKLEPASGNPATSHTPQKSNVHTF